MIIEVAAAVLVDGAGRVLLAERPPGKHLAGMWEFPGGKIESGESVQQALRRELIEELDIEAVALVPFLTVPWSYPEKTLRLHALRITAWHGEPRACEGQRLRWQVPEQVASDGLAPADRLILAALREYLRQD